MAVRLYYVMRTTLDKDGQGPPPAPPFSVAPYCMPSGGGGPPGAGAGRPPGAPRHPVAFAGAPHHPHHPQQQQHHHHQHHAGVLGQQQLQQLQLAAALRAGAGVPKVVTNA